MMEWLGFASVEQPRPPRLPGTWRYTLRGCAVGLLLGATLSCGGLWFVLSLAH